MPNSARKRILYIAEGQLPASDPFNKQIQAAGGVNDFFFISMGDRSITGPGADAGPAGAGPSRRASLQLPPNAAQGKVDAMLHRQLRQWEGPFDLVHLQDLTPATLAIAASKHLQGIPKVLSVHGEPAGPVVRMLPQRAGATNLEPWLKAAGIVQVLAATPELKEVLITKFGVPAEKLRTMPGTATEDQAGWLPGIYLETLMTSGKLPGERPYRQCTHCVLDTNDDKFIQFDEAGMCTYCHWYQREDPRNMFKGKDREKMLADLVARIKRERKHPKYDCIAGVSGGVDSSYTALKLKELGLTPLLVHLDNGYNSEVSNSNVQRMVEHLGFDLHNHAPDWEEFKNIQLAFLRASVMDIELVTDHAMVAYLFNLAAKLDIKFIISGHNFATEGILPEGWYQDKMDLLNIRAIARRFGGVRLHHLPRLSYWRRQYLYLFKGFEGVKLLNFLDYDTVKAKEEIIAKLGWKDYGAKHTESIFTRFYQNYILPTKFHIDKRKAHLATLICSGTMDRQTALNELAKPPYTPEEFKSDLEFVTGKLGITVDEFNAMMKAPIRDHLEFPSYITRHYRWEREWAPRLRPLTRLVKRVVIRQQA